MQKQMRDALDRRLNSPGWDSIIAGTVIKKRNRRITAGISSAFLLVVLAGSGFIYSLYTVHPSDDPGRNASLNAFITQQIDGAYRQTSAPGTEKNGSTDSITVDSTDTNNTIDIVIEESLSVRGI